MGKVILFPCKTDSPVDQIDLYTAVDVAIRDLRDIAEHSSDAIARERADECRQMLEAAYDGALASG